MHSFPLAAVGDYVLPPDSSLPHKVALANPSLTREENISILLDAGHKPG